MGMYTYISNEEKRSYSATVDSDINELFQEVRRKFGHKYLIREQVHYRKKIFRKKVPYNSYTLYLDHNGSSEVQVFNWPPLKGDWSINGSAPKAMVIAYFLGLLTGFDYK